MQKKHEFALVKTSKDKNSMAAWIFKKKKVFFGTISR